MHYFFGVIIPYLAVLTFLVGLIARILQWANVPVPLPLCSTGGQQRPLHRVKANETESPTTTLGVIKGMVLEVLLFRSLFTSTRLELENGPKVNYWSSKWLWLAGLACYWSFIVIVTRHLRFFIEPIPFFVNGVENLDGLFEITIPSLYITNAVIVVALTYIVLRRIFDPKLRSLSDYFPLFLILSVVLSGILMRHVFRSDVLSIKAMVMGLISFQPVVPEEIGLLFYIHLFFVSVLIAYFPFSTLIQLGREKTTSVRIPAEKE